MMAEQLLSLSFETAEQINRSVDILHSFFPALSFFAVYILFESLLPKKDKFENLADRIITYIKLPFLLLLNLIVVSQGLLGGCVIYYPQKWFNQRFLGVEEPYEFGLFARHLFEPDQFWILRLFYIIASAVVIWRTWEFLRKRVPLK